MIEPKQKPKRNPKNWLRGILCSLTWLIFAAILLRRPDFQTAEGKEFKMRRSADQEAFVEQWCNLQGEDWYPGGWQERTPYFLLAGAKKSGTSSLFVYLSTHPNLSASRVKELLFFLTKNFPYYHGNKTLVKDARNHMYKKDYKVKKLQDDESLLGFEATPGYFFQSTKSPQRILCTCPWVKILLILREPVDRVWSNYNFYQMRRKDKMPNFETWVKSDLNRLKAAGVLNREQSFPGTTEEYEAWDKYLNVAQEGPLGRSMYAIQLKHWYDALKAIGRDPTKDIFIVRTEDLERDIQTTMNRIFSWLKLPHQQFPVKANKVMVSKYEQPYMTNEMRVMLEEFFRPYNQRLNDMLGGDWPGIWDTQKNNSAVEEGAGVQMLSVTSNGKRKKEAAEIGSLAHVLNSPPSNASPVYKVPSYNASVAASFVTKWCEMRNVQEWYPTGADSWQLRAPYFMLPGVRKSGTTSLAQYIMQHPKVARARTKELQFFLNKNFRKKYVRDADRKTLVKQARLGYEREFRKPQLVGDPSLISMDATPGYVFFSTILPQRILCVCPWIKVLIIMRNPVDQVYSNYAYTKRVNGMNTTFENWISRDFELLKETGFIVDNGKLLSREEEDEAWMKYLKLTIAGQIGRSLYEVQLRHWYQAMRDIGRDPETQIYIVRTEDMKKDLDGEYRKILDFLGLPYHPITSTEEKVVSNYTGLGLTMKNETRKKLETFFAPYNKRLYSMLGGDWDGYWDPPAKAS